MSVLLAQKGYEPSINKELHLVKLNLWQRSLTYWNWITKQFQPNSTSQLLNDNVLT